MRKTRIIFTFLNFFFVIVHSFEFPPNPCESIFKYIYNGQAWLGQIIVPSPPPSLNTARISVNFSIEGYITNYGPIELDEQDKALDKIEKGYPLTFIVNLPKSKYLPRVIQIEYNGDILCYGSSASGLEPENGRESRHVRFKNQLFVVVPPPSTSFWLQYTFNWTGVFTPLIAPIMYTIPPPQATHRTPVDSPIIFENSPIHTNGQIRTSTSSTTSTTTTTRTTRAVTPKKFSNYEECGSIRKKRNTIKDESIELYLYNGVPTASTSHPWLAALFDVQPGKREEFFCAGNLISNKHVLTAAHCTDAKKDTDIQAKLGIHNTNNLFDTGTQRRKVTKVIKHPEYRSGNAHADMSFVVLDEEVIFTPVVKPICLWHYNSDFGAIVGYPGIIMGWGLKENGEQSSIPMKTEVTITTRQKCREVELIKNLVTDETFCAGRKGTGPCMGDSGGGLFIIIDGKWYLRGIISTSIADQKTQVCDVNTYSIYVDTAKYMNWIVNNMEFN